MSTQSAASRYDRALSRARTRRLPAGAPQPQPSAAWPPENVALLQRYRAFLEEAGLSQDCIDFIYIPMAGHVLGLNLKPHSELDLEADLARAADYIRAKQLSAIWTRNCGHALNRFRRFLRQERGLVEVHFCGVDLGRYQAGLPDWLVDPLSRYQRLRQVNWRPARLPDAIRRFWCSHVSLWRWLLARYPISRVTDLKRQYVFDYVDHRLAAGCAASTVNQDIRELHAFLGYLQEHGEHVPQALLRIRGLKEPDPLPRFLTDEQVWRLRGDLEDRVTAAPSFFKRRDALLDRAAFYLLWQAGMRLGEVEELCLGDLDLAHRRLMVRQGKGKKDRPVYLTDGAVRAVEAYLAVRGPGQADHVFLYRSRPLKKCLIQARIKAAGERVGVKATPHRLRHTYATQLVNAGCRITSLQQLLGHRHISTTLVYARLHDRTVSEDFYTAMAQIEQRLNAGASEQSLAPPPPVGEQTLSAGERTRLLVLAGRLAEEPLGLQARLDLVQQMQGLLGNGCSEPPAIPANGRTAAAKTAVVTAGPSW